MKYYSTRDKNVSLSAAEAVKMGLSRDGGLLTPCEIPQTEEPEGEDIPGDDIRPEPAIPVKEPYLPKPADSPEETVSGIEEYPASEELDQRAGDNVVSEIRAA